MQYFADIYNGLYCTDTAQWEKYPAKTHEEVKRYEKTKAVRLGVCQEYNHDL